MPVQMPNATLPYTVAEPAGTDNRTSDTSQTEGISDSGSVIGAVFGDGSDKEAATEDFLTLMVAQLKNQDFMNPVDDAQCMAQLAQISTMQQMEEMSYDVKSTYMASLVDGHVATAKFMVSDELKKAEGIVDKISLLDKESVIYVNEELYNMDKIMEIKTEPANNPDDSRDKKPGEDKNPEEGSDKTQCTYKTDSNRIRAQEDEQWIQ